MSNFILFIIITMVWIKAVWELIKDSIAGFLGNILAFFAGRHYEKQANKLREAQERLKDIEDAKDIHNRIIIDDEYRQRVREQYGIKD